MLLQTSLVSETVPGPLQAPPWFLGEALRTCVWSSLCRSPEEAAKGQSAQEDAPADVPTCSPCGNLVP